MEKEKLYKDYNEGDFLCDEYFQEWIIHPDEEKNNFWENWLKENPSKAEIVAKARGLLDGIAFIEHVPTETQVNNSLAKSLAAIEESETKQKTSPAIVRRIGVSWKVRVAAAIIILLATGAYFYFNNKQGNQIVKTNEDTKQIKNDIAPGGNRAVLTLADGSTIVLDSAAKGTVTQQGTTKVLKLDEGQLAYNSNNKGSADVLYNTISTPRGGQYQVMLSDGSKIWLNAESSVRFPTVFAGKVRSVEITGEAYLEVAPDKSKPFIVSVNKMKVEVLGTHFNINAYTDEPDTKVTLLEGSVKVSRLASDVSKVLKPGEQARTTSDLNFQISNDIDVSEVMAWKNGYFQFNGKGIESVMRQLARWYDINVQYEGQIPARRFAGQIDRGSNLSEVLKILQESNVHFTLNGRSLIVTP